MIKKKPPRAEKHPVASHIHGCERIDDYAWLRAENWQEILADPQKTPSDIKTYLDAENDYSTSLLEPTRALQRELVTEMRGRMQEDESETPWPDGPYEYYYRYREGGQQKLYCRKPRNGGEEEILLDGDKEAEGKAFFQIANAVHSTNHAWLAWSYDDKGSELYAIRIRNLENGRDLPDILTRTDGSVVWGAHSDAFYYVRLDQNHRPAQVVRHLCGSAADGAADGDDLILEENDPAWFIHLNKSCSGQYAIAVIHDHNASECWLIDLSAQNPLAACVAARELGVRYSVEPHRDRLFIRTNADNAEDFKIMTAPLHESRRENWRDFIPAKSARMIVHMTLFSAFLVRLEREECLPRLVVRDLQTDQEHSIAFEEEAYALSLREGLEFDTTTLRFSYSSMTTPEETYEYDMASRQRTLRKKQSIPSGHDPKNYKTRRLFARAPDGAMVPISLLARTDVKAHAPCLLYGYGAYGHALSASFSSNRLSLVDRGFVYAIAHVRGGTDKGWNWYETGKLRNKPNSFSDFIAAAQALITAEWTEKGRIVAQGGSAGGMLMGVVANQAPELFAGVIADVPFVDVVNTMLDANLPLTPPEWLEWGNPITDAEAFKLMLSYSPYDNVKAQHYPAILALAGLTDPRVTYWEPAKWVAKLRSTMKSGGPILLHTNMDAGHGGASGRFHQLEEIAQEQAFALFAVREAFKDSAL